MLHPTENGIWHDVVNTLNFALLDSLLRQSFCFDYYRINDKLLISLSPQDR